MEKSNVPFEGHNGMSEEESQEYFGKVIGLAFQALEQLDSPKMKEIQEYVKGQVAENGDEYRPVYTLLLFENPDKEMVQIVNGEAVHTNLPDLGENHEPGFYHDLISAVAAVNHPPLRR